MGLDFSQKRLLGSAMRGRNQRLRLYAFLTGVMSTVISLVHLIVIASK